MPERLPAGIRAVTLYEVDCAAGPDCDWWDDGDYDRPPAWATPDAARAGARGWGFRPDALGSWFCETHADALGLPPAEPAPGQLAVDGSEVPRWLATPDGRSSTRS